MIFDILGFCDSAFGDSDSDDNDNDQDNHNDNDQEIPDAVIPIPPACRPRAGLAPPPFDMMEFMHETSSYDMQKVFRLADSMPVIPVHIPCERPGGDARRAILKARVANVPQARSVSEVFALDLFYLTLFDALDLFYLTYATRFTCDI